MYPLLSTVPSDTIAAKLIHYSAHAYRIRRFGSYKTQIGIRVI